MSTYPLREHFLLYFLPLNIRSDLLWGFVNSYLLFHSTYHYCPSTMTRTCNKQMNLSLAGHLIEEGMRMLEKMHSWYIFIWVDMHRQTFRRKEKERDWKKEKCRTNTFVIDGTFPRTQSTYSCLHWKADNVYHVLTWDIIQRLFILFHICFKS